MSKDYEIEASPTKQLFIEMLTKDISLEMAIAELIDNSIDGALTSINKEKKEFKDFKIEIKLDEYKFEIADNCGGMAYEIAKKVAFRFGRPIEVEPNEYSVGRFGVGMKRSIFKMGSKIDVLSHTKDNKIEVEIDVNSWESNQENWTHNFKNYDLTTVRSFEETGTCISINKLYPGVVNKFKSEKFITDLMGILSLRNEMFLDRGLVITINNVEVKSQSQELLISDKIMPAYYEIEIEQVSTKIVAGITEAGYPGKAGWYIYCNDRLILDADRSGITGWGNGVSKYHPTFARFRGYVYFSSKNPELLPWNTTKTDVDFENTMFISIREEMIKIMKPILDFLRKQSKDNEEVFERIFSECEKIKSEAIRSEKGVNINVGNINNVVLDKLFLYPIKEVQAPPNYKTISYTVPINDFIRVSEVMNKTIAKEVGEETFNYYLNSECED